MRLLLWLPRMALACLIMMSVWLVGGALVNVASGIEIEGDPVRHEWLFHTGKPVPQELASLARQTPELQLERALIVVRPVRRLFNTVPQRMVTTCFTCWRIIDHGLLEYVANEVERKSGMRSLWDGASKDHSRHKPAWWPPDLMVFHTNFKSEFEHLNGRFCISKQDPTRLY